MAMYRASSRKITAEASQKRRLMLRLRRPRGGWTRWQATFLPSASRRSGSIVRQSGIAYGQRVWKRQPEGGSIGLGTSPVSTMRSRARSSTGSGTGTAESSDCV